MSEGPYRVVPSDKNGWWVVGSPVGRLGWFDEETDAHKAVRIANTAHAAALASSKPSAAFVAMRTAIQYIMDGVAYTQKSMPGGCDVLLDATRVHVNSQYLIKARAALALAEKETGI